MLSLRSLKTICKTRLISIVRFSSTKKKFEDVDICNIRNLGILAHIDAGIWQLCVLIIIVVCVHRQNNFNRTDALLFRPYQPNG